jgi:hypothetical protein
MFANVGFEDVLRLELLFDGFGVEQQAHAVLSLSLLTMQVEQVHLDPELALNKELKLSVGFSSGFLVSIVLQSHVDSEFAGFILKKLFGSFFSLVIVVSVKFVLNCDFSFCALWSETLVEKIEGSFDLISSDVCFKVDSELFRQFSHFVSFEF